MALRRLLGASVVLAYVFARYSPYSIGLTSSIALSVTAALISYAAWIVVIYPKLFSPLRHLPTPPNGGFFTGQTRTILKDVSGMPMRRWTETVPNDGLIRYSMWWQERLLLTNPKVLGEVLVNKNYDFVKVRGQTILCVVVFANATLALQFSLRSWTNPWHWTIAR